MKQVFANQKCELHNELCLDEKQAHHLFDVLRTKENEIVRVVCEDEVYLAHPTKKPYLFIFGKEEVEPRLVDVTLCVALIKSDRFEWMLQKACELGVRRIVPFVSRYSIIQLDDKKALKKMERWNSILLSACKQCNRNDKVELFPITTIEELAPYKSLCNVVAYEKENGTTHHLANYLQKNPSSVTACIGPEGGFTPDEIELLNDLGYASCSLGNDILRSETAACYILSSIEYQTHCENLEVE
ncbi:RsmE family RNA methyltransferase [Firmicutes bacterium M10-2]|nr:RsmE family RNA methyltransferase [Firmicutes bacterium M10-2]